jgi:hypothetical protein
VSSHVGEAAASPSSDATPPEEQALGLDRRRERYWLIERRCKDLCLYLDVLTGNMPRYVRQLLWRCNPEHRPEIYAWICRHRPAR